MDSDEKKLKRKTNLYAVCAKCKGQPALDYGRLADGVIISPCERCGGSGIVITCRGWKNMRKRVRQGGVR